MPRLFLLQPEVAGGFGPRTVIANRAELHKGAENIPRVTRLEYVFDGWLGDELLETFPCFIVTTDLAGDLARSNLTGLHFDDVQISRSDMFKELHPRRKLPSFRRLIPQGTVEVAAGNEVRTWSGHDVCLTDRAQLVVSEPVLQVLRRHALTNCKVTDLT